MSMKHSSLTHLLAAPVACLLFASGVHASDPDVLYVTGTIRDFLQLHPDFYVDGNTRHVASNASSALISNVPLYTGVGYTVATQWKNGEDENIPPHLAKFSFGGAGVIPVSEVSNYPTGGHAKFDTYDSTLGPYGGDNVGPAPVYQVGAPMPNLSIPAHLYSLASEGNVSLSGTNTISTNRRFNTLTVSGTLMIDGQVSIFCEGVFRLATHGKIRLQPGATLDLYLAVGADEIAGADAWNHVEIGDSLNPHRTRIHNLSPFTVMIHNHAAVWAVILSPNAPVSITNHGELFGLVMAKKMIFGNHGKLHLDQGVLPMFCGEVVNDTAGAPGSSSSGMIASAATFSDWFQDRFDANTSINHTIALIRNDEGIYEYVDDAFYPIDGRLYGNESQAHNYNFTFSFNATFTYEGCGGQFLEFYGADDAWAYVDGKLGLDLGGVLPLTRQVVELDRFNLVDGETYQLRFFYAQRNPHTSVFRLRTNVVLDTPSTQNITAMFD